MGMKGYWAIPVLATILILGTFVLSQDVFVPPPQKPEKLTITDVSWNAEDQSFIVEFSVLYGIANAGENSDFVIVGTLNIDDGTGDSTDIEMIGALGTEDVGDNTPRNEPVTIFISVPIDPNNFPFQGLVDVTVDAEIQNPVGSTGINEAVHLEVFIDIGFPGGCQVDADCDNGLFCDGAETCLSGACIDGTPAFVDDSVACTDDSCDEGTDSIVNTPNDTNCNDGLFCNGSETCDAVLDCQDQPDPCTFQCNEDIDACVSDNP